MIIDMPLLDVFSPNVIQISENNSHIACHQSRRIFDMKSSRNGYRIYVDIMTGQKFVQFRLLTWPSLNSKIVHPVLRGMGGGIKPAKSFTLLEYIIIWCKI